MSAAGPVQDYRSAFDGVAAAVERGETDLGRLGFWRLVTRVKADPVLAAHWAETVGRIDRAAFERAVRWRIPVWAGNTLLAVGTIAGAGAVVVAANATSDLLAGLALLAAGGIWSLTVHDPAHWLVGRLVGIRFLWYFPSWWPPPPRPGLKVDYASYLRTPPAARAVMHASGAIATKAAPFAALATWPATQAPAWAAWGLLALGAFEIATDVLFSVHSSDWKRFRREVRVARVHASHR